MFFSNWKTGFFGALSIITEVAHKIWKLTDFGHNQDDNTVNEILFYGAEDENKRTTQGLQNLFIIYFLILDATKSIDMCIPNLTSENLKNCLIQTKNQRKVSIRLALHNVTKAFNIRNLLKCGIEVKIINSKVRFNYEFALIDSVDQLKDGTAMLGSFDYELKRVNCNLDSTILTGESAVLAALRQEFNRIWHSSDNTVYDLNTVIDIL